MKMKPQNIKTKLVIANVIVAVFALGMPQKLLNAQGNNCIDPVNQGPCHAATSTTTTVQCQVNCLCPYSSSINQECFNSWKMTLGTTASLTSNWGCTPGSTYLSCNPSTQQICFWSVIQANCPSILPGQGCLPTLSYVTAGPGPMTVLDLTGCSS
jgi:hypothetical protein